MATEIILPKLGFSMTEGQIAEWLVADGWRASDRRPRRCILLEADKASNEIDAPASGTFCISNPK